MKAHFAAVALTLLGCHAPVGSTISVPEDAAETCRDQCHNVGLRLSAVAIMANNVGCVCQANEAAAVGQQEAVTGGMATILLQQQEQQRQQTAQQQPAFKSSH
jgi:hypothetical protein